MSRIPFLQQSLQLLQTCAIVASSSSRTPAWVTGCWRWVAVGDCWALGVRKRPDFRTDSVEVPSQQLSRFESCRRVISLVFSQHSFVARLFHFNRLPSSHLRLQFFVSSTYFVQEVFIISERYIFFNGVWRATQWRIKLISPSCTVISRDISQ
jgi:hypothetical protein